MKGNKLIVRDMVIGVVGKIGYCETEARHPCIVYLRKIEEEKLV